jgi:hypothetical protein
MQEIPAREDTTREVAHETSGHDDTVVAAMPHNVARSAQPGTSASNGAGMRDSGGTPRVR